jgi:hypothetical protein
VGYHARALVNAGYLTVDDIRAVPFSELAAIPRVGQKSFSVLLEVMWRKLPDTSMGQASNNQERIQQG